MSRSWTILSGKLQRIAGTRWECRKKKQRSHQNGAPHPPNPKHKHLRRSLSERYPPRVLSGTDVLVELAVGLLFLAVGAAAALVIAILLCQQWNFFLALGLYGAGALLVWDGVGPHHASGLRQGIARQNAVQNGLRQNRVERISMGSCRTCRV